MGGAAGDTGRDEACRHAVLAAVAFDDLAARLVPLGDPPRAGADARPAPHAEVADHVHQAVFLPLHDGAGRAGRHTPWFFAVKARSKGRGHSNFIVKARRSGADQEPRPHRGRGAVLDLALHFAGPAADAAALVEFDQIFAHDNSRKNLEAVTAQVVRLKAEGLKIKCKARLPPFKA